MPEAPLLPTLDPGKPQGRLLFKQRGVPPPSLALASLSVIGFFRVCGKTCYQSLACLTVAKYDLQSNELYLSHHTELYFREQCFAFVLLKRSVGALSCIHLASCPNLLREWSGRCFIVSEGFTSLSGIQ